jgi:hypothetical protein
VGEDGGLIAGHARILAARQLGIAKIPVMVAAGWTEAQKRAYVLADNQLTRLGGGAVPVRTHSSSATKSARNAGVALFGLRGLTHGPGLGSVPGRPPCWVPAII